MSTSAEYLSHHHLHPVPGAAEDMDKCPLCDQPVPPEKLALVRGRVAARDQELLAKAAGHLKDQFAREKLQAEAKARDELQQARQEAAAATERLTREAAQRESAIRQEALKSAQFAVQAQLAEADNARRRIEEAMQAKQTLLASVQSKIAEADAARRAAEQQALLLKSEHELDVQRRVHEARVALENEKRASVAAEQAKTFEERQKLQAKVQELQRQIEHRTAQEMGEGADINLYETLRMMFYEDRFSRTGQSIAGANLIHEIVHNGQVCGRIVYDTHNRSLWRNDYILKLREDKVSAKAEHAIYASNKFPAGARQLHIQDGVILACPARVAALAELLRTHIIQMHEQRIGNEARGEKTAALYAFITSERCSQLLEMIASLVEKVLEIDVAEHRAHQLVWEKRGRLLKSVLKAQGDMRFEIGRIVGTVEARYQTV